MCSSITCPRVWSIRPTDLTAASTTMTQQAAVCLTRGLSTTRIPNSRCLISNGTAMNTTSRASTLSSDTRAISMTIPRNQPTDTAAIYLLSSRIRPILLRSTSTTATPTRRQERSARAWSSLTASPMSSTSCSGRTARRCRDIRTNITTILTSPRSASMTYTSIR